LIALSWLFLLAAVATLLVGVFSDLVWVYVSIGASVLAMILLLVGIVRRKPVQPATAGAPYGPPVGEAAAAPAAATAVSTAPAAPAAQRRPATPSAPTAPADKPAPRKTAASKSTTAKSTTRKSTASKSTASKSTAAKSTAGKSTAKKTAAATASSRAMVVAIPERGTYHESGCRYVQGRSDTERLQKKTAQSRGFKACGVCKP
jgi:hypothetical protein